MDTSAAESANLFVENIRETIETSHESYQSSSIEKENLEENQVRVSDYTQETTTNNDKFSANLVHYQENVANTCSLEPVKYNVEANVDNSDIKSSVEAVTMTDSSEGIQETTNESNLADNVATEEHPQVGVEAIASEDVQIEQFNENAPISEQASQLGKGAQSSKYTSEYMLEHHTENVYMPEQQGHEEVSLVSSEQVYSTDSISDDGHENDSTYEKVDHIENSTVVEGMTEMIEDNFVSAYQKEHENEENMSSSLQSALEKSSNSDQIDENVQESHEKTFNTIDFTTSNNETNKRTSNMEKYDNNASDIDKQNVSENASNETSVRTILNVEESMTDKRIIKNEHAEGYVYNIKEEVHPIEVDRNNSVPDESEHGNQPIEHVIESTEIVEDETTHVADPLSENVQTYNIPDDIEVTVQDGEYTIVEGPSSLEISTDGHDEDTNSEETLVLLENYENSEDSSLATLTEEHEMYLTDLRNQSESRQSTSSVSSENKPRRGRKPTYDIPMHVLGHNISKPVESVPNGRAVPKPRLGVKVPYRNLTSQIVTKAEIEKEIMERARLKQEQANSRVTATIKPKEPQALPQNRETEQNVTETTEVDITSSQNNTIIQNDSDLLAILEGEGEEMPVLPKEVPQSQVDDSNIKMLEREIALQQLQDLPHQAPKQRIFRGRHVKSEAKAPVLIAEASALSKLKSTEKTALAGETSTSTVQLSQPVSNKENATLKQPVLREGPSASPKRDQSNVDALSPKRQPVDIEPQVKVNMVLKTYSRKRKTIELPESLADTPISKKAMLEESEINVEKPEAAPTTDVYVTKSSRVIKKKVIWDPDEIPSRSPKHMTRSENQTAKVVMKKLLIKKATTEKLAKEKPTEKKSNEKLDSKKNLNEKAVSPAEKKTPASKTDSPKASKTPIKNKKLRSEVDKLLMDEGAVKMLYELKNTDETMARRKKDVYSVEKAHKEIIKKANQIKNDLEQNTSNDSTKSLRKKETYTPSPVKPAQITALTERKMSKDSTRSSVHTPPGSPAYSFPYSQSSMLIRRRSSSSISSSDEIDTNGDSRVSKKKSASASSDAPKPKKVKKNEEVKDAVQPETSSTASTLKPAKTTTAENKLNQYTSFTVKKANRHAIVDLNYINEKCYCTVQVLEELTAVLKKLSKDKDCNVVSITSSSKAFCFGLDYTSLVSDVEDVRKTNATELAERVRGRRVQNSLQMIDASECTHDGMGSAAELLFTTQKMTADDAFRRGLISRICWPEAYNKTMKNLLSSMSKSSKQSLESIKKQLRGHHIQTAEAAIKSDTKILIEHWVSPECQKNFARSSEKGN
ncbi:hypothetical protein NQ314_019527 [Rhamnusium bicolor]|uniref:Uncharacterized protein n=1 Tax=Rhamnusium bicolor TaxID=1586634 RepID=A0AAV8WN30_9CUCU|nr:hypothetical protein NQ314_019527 [Rhamnusium bicolor]